MGKAANKSSVAQQSKRDNFLFIENFLHALFFMFGGAHEIFYYETFLMYSIINFELTCRFVTVGVVFTV